VTRANIQPRKRARILARYGALPGSGDALSASGRAA
jgi:hypothetical protein